MPDVNILTLPLEGHIKIQILSWTVGNFLLDPLSNKTS